MNALRRLVAVVLQRKRKAPAGGPLGRILSAHYLTETMRRVQECDEARERTDEKEARP